MSYGLINSAPQDWLLGFTRLDAGARKEGLANDVQAVGGHFVGMDRAGPGAERPYTEAGHRSSGAPLPCATAPRYDTMSFRVKPRNAAANRTSA
ncbi:hypothetical protein QFZ64_002566 [Streptomyces sp. B3I8]|nr:hypothetical protein [Streptomyces sp. B3I8]